jgi:hypothetical protein
VVAVVEQVVSAEVALVSLMVALVFHLQLLGLLLLVLVAVVVQWEALLVFQP